MYLIIKFIIKHIYTQTHFIPYIFPMIPYSFQLPCNLQFSSNWEAYISNPIDLLLGQMPHFGQWNVSRNNICWFQAKLCKCHHLALPALLLFLLYHKASMSHIEPIPSAWVHELWHRGKSHSRWATDMWCEQEIIFFCLMSLQLRRQFVIVA